MKQRTKQHFLKTLLTSMHDEASIATKINLLRHLDLTLTTTLKCHKLRSITKYRHKIKPRCRRPKPTKPCKPMLSRNSTIEKAINRESVDIYALTGLSPEVFEHVLKLVQPLVEREVGKDAKVYVSSGTQA